MPGPRGAQADILFDGGSRGNPGPSYGSYRLKLPGAATPKLCRLSFGRLTSNEAEYATLVAALEDLDRDLEQSGTRRQDVQLEIRGDSQLVLAQLAGEWRVRNARLRSYWGRATELLEGFDAVRYVRLPRWRVVQALGH
ncbi:MAG: ribonuclease HI family protein [Anaerolineales bacterium]|nr:ribonuclease HI family protein [Anaerolineales bacterium]